MVTNINFLLTIPIHCQEIRLWELINDHLRENALIFYQILTTHSLIKCIENSLENFYVYIGASRVNYKPPLQVFWERGSMTVLLMLGNKNTFQYLGLWMGYNL